MTFAHPPLVPPPCRPGRLRDLLRRGRLVTAPGVFDHISLKLADRHGFDALYLTGYGTVASHLGLPDAGLATFSDMLDRVSSFCAQASTPLICDGDTGYGGLLNVAHTVRGYERAGAAAIQLEDQEFPKKCGHTPGKRVIPCAEMERKISVAAAARSSEEFLIIARTDARATHGLEEALRRAERYAAAGADLLFVESPESEQELAEIGRRLDKPLVINMVEGGRTPILPADRLTEMGFALAIYPATGFLAAAHAMGAAYEHLAQTGGSSDLKVTLFEFSEFSRLMGFEAVWEFDRLHAD